MTRFLSGVFLTLVSAASAAPFINEFHAENVGLILTSAGTTTGVVDVDGNSSDWIELRNPDAAAVVINGWALSDDPAVPGKYVIPATPTISIAANGHLLIYASGKNQVRTVSGTQIHTNFKLSNSGRIILSRPDAGGWLTIHQMGTTGAPYPAQKSRFSYGFPGTTGPNGTPGFFETHTPGTTNGATVVTEFVADTSASVNRGFYSTPFNVTLATATPGATLLYTTDGREPTTQAGGATVVLPPNASTPPSVIVPITGTTILRMRAVKTGLGATNVDTQSYLFPEQVLQQSAASVTQTYVGWGHDKGDANTTQGEIADADWEMDPRVVNHANVEDRCVVTDLLEIPTISVVMNWAELFGVNGIYIAGEGVDKQGSFEVLNPNGSAANPNGGARQAAGKLHIFGGSSTQRWKSDKLSISFKFWNDLSTGVLGDDSIGKYSGLVLDARLNQVWNHSQDGTQRNRGDFVRDAVMSDLQNAVGSYAPHSQHVHLYLNGLYWGIYTLHEKPEDNFAANYLGGDNDDYDVVKHGPGIANFLVSGRVINPALGVSNTNHTAGVNYQTLLNLASADLSIQANYDALAAKLEIDDFIKYMLVNFYGANEDWAHQNWYASYYRPGTNGRWRFHSWDAEHVFKAANADATRNGLSNSAYSDKSTTGPTYLHHRLAGTLAGESPGATFTTQVVGNAEYRVKFGDAAHQYLFNGGLFTPAQGRAAFLRRFNDINEAIRAESARWGDSGPSTATSPSAELHLRYSNVSGTDYLSWWSERVRILDKVVDGATNRTTFLLSQLRTRGLYPSFDAPVFGQHGGTVPGNYALPMTNPGGAGTIYYTLDGTDPRVPLSGAISASALVYTGAVPLGSSRVVKARVRNAAGTAWSALNQAYFSVGTIPAAAGNLVISKIHYRPAAVSAQEQSAGFTDRSDFEFVELLNISTQRVGLSGLSFSAGLDIAFLPNGVLELAPGGRALFVANPAAFAARYGAGYPIAGQFVLGSNLDNNSETLTLRAANGATIVSVNYNDSAPWPTTPDGDGPSLVLMRPATSDASLGSNWRASTGTNGAPGADDRILFSSWQTSHFAAGDPLAAPLVDADGDGIPNVVEMGLGTNPKVPNPAAVLPSAQYQLLDVGAGLQPYLTFRCRTLKATEELAWAAQTTMDPSSGWTSSQAALVPVGTSVDNGDGTETRTFRSVQPVTGEARRFFRMQVILTP